MHASHASRELGTAESDHAEIVLNFVSKIAQPRLSRRGANNPNLVAIDRARRIANVGNDGPANVPDKTVAKPDQFAILKRRTRLENQTTFKCPPQTMRINAPNVNQRRSKTAKNWKR